MVAIFALYLFGYRFGFVIAEGRIDFEFRPIRSDADAEDLDFYTAPEAAVEGWGSYDAPATAAETEFVHSLR
jgi:hypothetical protein